MQPPPGHCHQAVSGGCGPGRKRAGRPQAGPGVNDRRRGEGPTSTWQGNLLQQGLEHGAAVDA
ncbi:MAG: hypothetical protein ACKOFW_09385, partial [Planctomycetaceae bacterium]